MIVLHRNEHLQQRGAGQLRLRTLCSDKRIRVNRPET